MQKNVPFIIIIEQNCKIFLPKMSRSKNIAIAKFEVFMDSQPSKTQLTELNFIRLKTFTTNQKANLIPFQVDLNQRLLFLTDEKFLLRKEESYRRCPLDRTHKFTIGSRLSRCDRSGS